MQLSKFGSKFYRPTGINQLMADLGDAFVKGHPDLCMLGGGNPAFIPAAQKLFADEMTRLIKSNEFAHEVGTYDGPHGNERFRAVLSEYLSEQYGWDLSERNIALTNGSQNSFFYLFNALAGAMPDGSMKKIMFPLAPEYIGYADAGIAESMFAANLPTIQELEGRMFKYRVDFNSLTIDEDVAAICFSRPTNPTGNVVTNEELAKLNKLALQHNIPLIVDNAYGQPFPNVIYEDVSPFWNQNTILCMSLSKLGLPGARTGIVVANEDIIALLGRISSIVTLAPHSMGAALMTRLIKDREVHTLCEDVLKPFYQEKIDFAKAAFYKHFAHLPVKFHKPEGAFFMWLWVEGMPISSKELYERLKTRNVLVIPGEDFFIDIDPSWRHKQECLRINYAQPDDKIDRGFALIAEEIRRSFGA